MSAGWQPVAPDRLAALLADWLAATPGTLRVAVDGPPCAKPAALADELAAALPALGRTAVHVEASWFWRDASLRLEHGREDVDSYLTWLDTDALRREVLDAAVERGHYLPSLRDPATNRSTRTTPRPVDNGGVVVVSGALLLGAGLPFDRTIHLAMSAPARARRTASAEKWTLPAYERYDTNVGPAERADLVVKLDDPRHPALRWTARSHLVGQPAVDEEP